MKPTTRSYYRDAVRDAVRTIVASLDSALDLDGLARGAATSEFHFHRVFRGMIGETPLELHRRLRLERAARALAFTDHTVSRIAADAGYETHAAFTRAFGAAFGMAPVTFRAEARCGDHPSWVPRCLLTARSGVHYTDQGVAWEDLYTTDEGQNMDVTVRTLEPLRVAYTPHRGSYHTISDAFARLGGIAGQAGLIGPGSKMLAVFHDDPEITPEPELRSEAAISVGDTALIPSGLEERVLPGGPHAVTMHIGPYSTLGDTWSRLMGQWLPASGHRLAEGVSYEVYLNMPGQVPEQDLRTELHIPLEAATDD
ncbi:MAG: GyrI-like domain-containing protein [Gemmatimonadota bacterium]